MIMYSVVKELAAAAELTQILLSIRATLCTESVISVQGYDAHAAQCSVVSKKSEHTLVQNSASRASGSTTRPCMTPYPTRGCAGRCDSTHLAWASGRPGSAPICVPSATLGTQRRGPGVGLHFAWLGSVTLGKAKASESV